MRTRSKNILISIARRLQIIEQRPMYYKDLEHLLHSIIVDFQTAERIRRDDFSFDAFKYISERFGHKSKSTLCKMCGPESSKSNAKLGFNDAIIICKETGDHRLLKYFKSQLISE